MIFKIINGKAVRYDSAGGITKIDDLSVDFSQAESRENISSADNMKTILGKIMKWFSDLSAGAASSLLGQDLTAGKVLVSDDGGKVSASAVDASKVGFLSGVTGDVQTQINSLNSAIESVNENFLKIVMQENAFYNEADSKKFIDNFSESFSRNTFYRFVIGNYYSSADPLSGYIWYVDGFKMGAGYEWQMARTYRPDTNGTLYYRTKYSSSWKAWVKIL